MLDQMHRVPEFRISHQRQDIIIRLLMKLSAMEPHIPRDGVPTNNGLLILEVGDNCGDDVASVADVAGDG